MFIGKKIRNVMSFLLPPSGRERYTENPIQRFLLQHYLCSDIRERKTSQLIIMAVTDDLILWLILMTIGSASGKS